MADMKIDPHMLSTQRIFLHRCSDRSLIGSPKRRDEDVRNRSVPSPPITRRFAVCFDLLAVPE